MLYIWRMRAGNGVALSELAIIMVFITSNGFPITEPIEPDVAPAANLSMKGAFLSLAPMASRMGPYPPSFTVV